MAQAKPAGAHAPLTIHLIECRSQSFGSYFAERSTQETIRDNTVNDLASGQVDNAVRVLELDPAAGTCRDVSVEVARDVLAQGIDHGLVGRDAMAFIERHLTIFELTAAWRRAA